MSNSTPSLLTKAIENAGQRKVWLVGLDLANKTIQVAASSVTGYDRPIDDAVKAKELPDFLLKNFPLASNKTIVAMESCGGANAWSEKLTALGFECYVFPAAVCRSFNRSLKDDRNDARGVRCALEVYLRNPEQATFIPCMTRDRDSREKMCVLNTIQALKQEEQILTRRLVDRLRELGVANVCYNSSLDTIARYIEEYFNTYHQEDSFISTPLCLALEGDVVRLVRLQQNILSLENSFYTPYIDRSPICKKIMERRGIGAETAVAISVVTQDNMDRFPTGRHLAAYSGLSPDHHGTGGKNYIGKNSSHGQPTLKNGFYAAGHAALEAHPDSYSELLFKKGRKRAALLIGHDLAVKVWWDYKSLADSRSAKYTLADQNKAQAEIPHNYFSVKTPSQKCSTYESVIRRKLKKIRRMLENRPRILAMMLCDDPIGTVKLLMMLRANFNLTSAELERMHAILASVDCKRQEWMKEFYNFGVAEIEEFVATSLQKMVGFDERPYSNSGQRDTGKHLDTSKNLFDENKCSRDTSFTFRDVDDLMFECLAAAQRFKKGEERNWVIAAECVERYGEIFTF